MSKEQLIEMARQAAQSSYSPYSKFRVGSAVLTKSGKHLKGCNIENASYGLSICAERVAIFKAVSEGEVIQELALSCVDAPSEASLEEKMPCGACRQVMIEFLPRDAQIHVDSVGSFTIEQLLPHGFELKS